MAKGVDEIICVAVNAPFALNAWGDVTGASAAGLSILGDSDGAFRKAIGMDFDAPLAGLIGRSKQYAMVVADGTVTKLHVEDAPDVCEVSGGEALLAEI